MFDLIGPKTNFNCFNFVSYNNSDNISLVVCCILSIRSLLLDLVNNSNDINILVLNKVCLMVPMKESMRKLTYFLLIGNLINFILFILKSDLGCGKLGLNKLNSFDIVALAFFKILLLFECNPSSDIDPNHLFVAIYKPQKQDGHGSILRFFDGCFHSY